ncbi:MAG: hypothetical protein IPL33_04200 [Sphingobacteriales bacterium]|nr:hypothetical protein [Sphingobacteriales bacterium]
MYSFRSYSLAYCLIALLCWFAAGNTTMLKAQHTINDVVKGVTSKSSKKPTTKTPKKTGFIANKFQDLTTRYNRYFNANLRYTEGIQSLEKNIPIITTRYCPYIRIKAATAQLYPAIWTKLSKKHLSPYKKNPIANG